LGAGEKSWRVRKRVVGGLSGGGLKRWVGRAGIGIGGKNERERKGLGLDLVLSKAVAGRWKRRGRGEEV